MCIRDRDNAARMSKKLGKGYSEAELRAVLAGEKEHTPTRATLHPEPKQTVSLMVDIQAVSYTHLDVYKRQLW